MPSGIKHESIVPPAARTPMVGLDDAVDAEVHTVGLCLGRGIVPVADGVGVRQEHIEAEVGCLAVADRTAAEAVAPAMRARAVELPPQRAAQLPRIALQAALEAFVRLAADHIPAAAVAPAAEAHGGIDHQMAHAVGNLADGEAQRVVGARGCGADYVLSAQLHGVGRAAVGVQDVYMQFGVGHRQAMAQLQGAEGGAVGHGQRARQEGPLAYGCNAISCLQRHTCPGGQAVHRQRRHVYLRA